MDNVCKDIETHPLAKELREKIALLEKENLELKEQIASRKAKAIFV